MSCCHIALVLDAWSETIAFKYDIAMLKPRCPPAALAGRPQYRRFVFWQEQEAYRFHDTNPAKQEFPKSDIHDLPRLRLTCDTRRSNQALSDPMEYLEYRGDLSACLDIIPLME